MVWMMVAMAMVVVVDRRRFLRRMSFCWVKVNVMVERILYDGDIGYQLLILLQKMILSKYQYFKILKVYMLPPPPPPTNQTIG